MLDSLALHSRQLPFFYRESDYAAEFNFFLRGKESMRIDARVPEIRGFTKTQVCSSTAIWCLFFYFCFDCFHPFFSSCIIIRLQT